MAALLQMCQATYVTIKSICCNPLNHVVNDVNTKLKCERAQQNHMCNTGEPQKANHFGTAVNCKRLLAERSNV